MPGLLLLLWLFSIVALWVCAIDWMRETAKEAEKDRLAMTRIPICFASLPPTLVFVVSAIVLLQAAPTVQFNAGSSLAMKLWSFWVHWWPAIFGFSVIQAPCYLGWFVGSLVTRTRVSARCAIGCAVVSSTLGSLLLSMAYPSA